MKASPGGLTIKDKDHYAYTTLDNSIIQDGGSLYMNTDEEGGKAAISGTIRQWEKAYDMDIPLLSEFLSEISSYEPQDATDAIDCTPVDDAADRVTPDKDADYVSFDDDADAAVVKDISNQLIEYYNDEDQDSIDELACSGEYEDLLTPGSGVDLHLEALNDSKDDSQLSSVEFSSVNVTPADAYTEEPDWDSLTEQEIKRFKLLTGGEVKYLGMADINAHSSLKEETVGIQTALAKPHDSDWCVGFFEGGWSPH